MALSQKEAAEGAGSCARCRPAAGAGALGIPIISLYRLFILKQVFDHWIKSENAYHDLRFFKAIIPAIMETCNY